MQMFEEIKSKVVVLFLKMSLKIITLILNKKDSSTTSQ